MVLYELLTGASLFGGGETVSDSLAAVITKEPDLTAVLPQVRPLVKSGLEKDPRLRLRDIGDVRVLLESSPAAPAPRRKGLSTALGALALAGLAAAGILAFLHFTERRPEAHPVRFEIPVEGLGRSISVSPDGRWLAFLDGPNVRLRGLDALETRTIAESDGRQG